ncbi:TolC family protein [Terriglobus saanensis]|uniref:Outer membrane efflux protein n=1 Tax=Terriglobus saanensis (strain ATCC BAA-1853 / DSM 23119 / SP1PR4) TaxID=401053 RepID=E8V0A3_TERSS|nr:TolC family protein [Terriglobus saanensis]ADV83321.1 outer membrane efflux protein [Terriglobus saanensis SP1PR4]
MKKKLSIAAISITLTAGAQTPATQTTSQTTVVETPAVRVAAQKPALRLDIPHSYNPINTYRATLVPAPNLANSPRIDGLIHNGILDLSLKDAIALALENNLDLAISRYNIPIASADVLRTQAGGSFRGVNTGVVQNTPGGGVGGFGSGSSGAGAGGTSGGAGGAGSGANGLVSSTLGAGTNVSSYDPTITGSINNEHYSQPLANLVVYGTPTLQLNDTNGNFGYSQAFPTGTSFSAVFKNNRETTNSSSSFLNPSLTTYYSVQLQQQLLAGFGLGPNLRFLRIAKNNQRISDAAFRLQVATTITQIANMYWDLVAAYEDEGVKERALEFARQTLDSGQKQLALQAIPAMDVMKDEAEVANREQDVTIAKTTLQFQELLIKNALTKNLDDPILEAIPVHPTDKTTALTDAPAPDPVALIDQALKNRIELSESDIDLENRRLSRDAARNALLPTVSLIGYYGGTGLAGVQNPNTSIVSTAPVGFGGAVRNAFNNTAPDYYVGLNMNIPLRNRVAKSDQYRAELETRQSEIRLQQQKKQIRIEVRNAQYALAQSQARVTSAIKSRDLAQKTFEITGKEQELGAGSNLQTLTARRDLSIAESALVAAMTAYEKAKIELDRALGTTLEANTISIESAKTGIAANQ